MANEETDWTAMEIDTLKGALADGLSIEEAAEILDRKVDEVRNKCRELGLNASTVRPD